MNIPEIVKVFPRNDFTVLIFFANGKVTKFDMRKRIKKGTAFEALSDINIFVSKAKILNYTLAWDLSDNNDERDCLDVAPEALWRSKNVTEWVSKVLNS